MALAIGYNNPVKQEFDNKNIKYISNLKFGSGKIPHLPAGAHILIVVLGGLRGCLLYFSTILTTSLTNSWIRKSVGTQHCRRSRIVPSSTVVGALKGHYVALQRCHERGYGGIACMQLPLFCHFIVTSAQY